MKMYGIETFKEAGPGVLTAGYGTQHKFSHEGKVLNKIIHGTPFYPEWYGEATLHTGEMQRTHINGESGTDAGSRLKKPNELYLNGDFVNIADNAQGRIYWDDRLVGALEYAAEMGEIDKYMEKLGE
ncbi:MAG: hypothetical protein KAT28_02305 [Candidatus Aenigmarchaeota archaeon]|nr:hypothetical protein [Candidatus Aenigmarchaeota archaeon]